MLAETTVTTARATDVTDGDVVKINGCWRLVMDVARSTQDVLDVYSSGSGKKNHGLYDEMAKAYDELDKHWEGDYVILRYCLQERSTPGEIEDAVKVMDALALVEVQVRKPRGGEDEHRTTGPGHAQEC